MAISVELDFTLQSQVERRQGRSAQWIVCEAIRQYVAREEARESIRQEALAAWAHYRETGLHLTGEEVIEWLERWGKGSDARLPDCHT